MPNEKEMADVLKEDLPEGVKPEGDPFKTNEEEKETPTASPAEKEPVEKEPSQEGDNTPDDNVPFHKHPRWKKLQEENEAMRNQLEEFNKFREEVSPILSEKREKIPAIPQWFEKLYGSDEDVWALYYQNSQEERKALKEQLVKDIRAEQEQMSEASKQEATRWDNYVQTKLDELRDEGKLFNEAKLTEIALKYLPSDSQGNIDFHKAFEIMQALETPEDKKARKTIASKTNSDNRGEPAIKSVTSGVELRGKTSWREWANN